MSFSGGGYHAHAGASGVIMSLIDRMRNEQSNASADIGMCEITKNVGAFSSNSGGSWFLSQAAYTDKFLQSLEEPDAWKAYTEPGGYFGEANKYISTLQWNSAVCDPLNNELIKRFYPNAYSTCVTDLQAGDSYLKFLLSSGDANWHRLAEEAVFGKKFFDASWHTMAAQANGPLLGTRQNWTKNKSLIFASGLLTQQPALKMPTLGIDTLNIASLEGYQRNTLVPGAAPVMFTVLGSSSDRYPPMLPGGDTILKYGEWDTRSEKFIEKADLQQTLPQFANYENIKIIDVAASSSAAGAGFIDISNMRESNLPGPLASTLDNFAPAFTFIDPEGATYVDDVGSRSLDKISQQKLVRLADGGFVDNTAVAYMVRYLAENNKLPADEEFNILAMDNYPAPRLEDANSKAQFPTGPDIAALFGYPDPKNDTRTSTMFTKFKYTGLVPHIFDASPYFQEKSYGRVPTKDADWCGWIEPEQANQGSESTGETKCVILNAGGAPDPDGKKCNIYISYTHYKVTLLDNEYFGITGGATGNLHVFSVLGEKTGVVPSSKFQADCYSKLMTGLHQAVADDHMFGNKLASLLGL